MRKFHPLVLLKMSLVLAYACIALSGSHPPALAQVERPSHAITSEDAVQDINIAEANHHIENTDTNLHDLAIEVRAANLQTAKDIATIETEIRVAAGILSLLTGAGLVIQIKRKTT